MSKDEVIELTCSICLDNIHSLKEKCDIFNKCKYFYCYDPNTAYMIFAVSCGCITILHPVENVSKKTYLRKYLHVFFRNLYVNLFIA